MTRSNSIWLVGLACLALAGCGGGGGGGSTNQSPSASFTLTPTVGQVPLAVNFNASASSDPDGSLVSYNWIFGDNSTGSGVSATHTYTTAGTYTVTLTVTDNRGATAATTRTVTATAGPPPTSVTVSGRITFERVPFSPSLGTGGMGDGLNYVGTFEAPAREIEVELVQSSNQAVLATAVTDLAGHYTLSAPPSTDVLVRAKALSRHAGTAGRPASWDIRVRNNTNANAQYVLDSSVFNTGIADQTRDLRAATGWGGGFSGTYTGVRAAAPFAILDTIYAATQFVITEGDDAVQFIPLTAYWSPSNVPADGEISAGEIGTTSYYPVGTAGVAPGIYVLGAASNDTDEFDQHVIAHEFVHYLEDAVSRTDTTGGPHSLDEQLDMRLAFSEGYGNAFAGMVLGDPVYRDSFGTAQGDDFNFSLETLGSAVPGWFNETTVQRVMWDLFDSANDGGDTVSLGYGPLHDVFTTELKDEVPLTSVFPFITALKQRAGVPVAAVDTLVEFDSAGADFGIDSVGMTAYAATETHDGGSDSSLPVYTTVAIGGSQRVCADRLLGTYNALGNRRFLRFSLDTQQGVTIRVSCDATSDPTCSGTPAPDPDFVLSRASTRWIAEELGTSETLGPLTLDAGDYVLEVYEYSHVDPAAESSERRDRTCMTVNITG